MATNSWDEAYANNTKRRAGSLYHLPKRTRLNIIQSKNGCLTCRSRKVKCDEGKPTCLRCFRASKACEGYITPWQSRSSNNEDSSVNAHQTRREVLSGNTLHTIAHLPFSKCKLSPREVSLSRLGLELLLQHPLEDIHWSKQPPWIRLITQLLVENDAVTSAVISLGAVFEVQCLPVPETHLSLAQTHKALAALMREVTSPTHGLVPVFLASVVLAGSEVLQRHLTTALIHLKGAFRALTSSNASSSCIPHLSNGLTDQQRFGHDMDGLYSFALSLDLQTSWYALSETPKLEPSFQHSNNFILMQDLPQSSILSLLHSCYHFTIRAARFKYRLHGDTPPSLILEQSRYIALLTDWLAGQPKPKPREAHRQTLVQRVQCLSTLIYLSIILCPYEMTYDLYAAHFREIVDTSNEVVALSEMPDSVSSLLHFKTQPDLFQPLYLTAMKCRDPHLRRQAVAIFSQFGIEGPWDPRIMTRVAQRAIEIEEMGQVPEQADLPIEETRRIHGCGVDSFAPVGKTFSMTFGAHFSLCRNVPMMLQSANHEDSEHWILWSEDLEVGEFYSKPAL